MNLRLHHLHISNYTILNKSFRTVALRTQISIFTSSRGSKGYQKMNNLFLHILTPHLLKSIALTNARDMVIWRLVDQVLKMTSKPIDRIYTHYSSQYWVWVFLWPPNSNLNHGNVTDHGNQSRMESTKGTVWKMFE